MAVGCLTSRSFIVTQMLEPCRDAIVVMRLAMWRKLLCAHVACAQFNALFCPGTALRMSTWSLTFWASPGPGLLGDFTEFYIILCIAWRLTFWSSSFRWSKIFKSTLPKIDCNKSSFHPTVTWGQNRLGVWLSLWQLLFILNRID